MDKSQSAEAAEPQWTIDEELAAECIGLGEHLLQQIEAKSSFSKWCKTLKSDAQAIAILVAGERVREAIGKLEATIQMNHSVSLNQ